MKQEMESLDEMQIRLQQMQKSLDQSKGDLEGSQTQSMQADASVEKLEAENHMLIERYKSLEQRIRLERESLQRRKINRGTSLFRSFY